MINIVLYGFGNISHALISEANFNKFNISVLTSFIGHEDIVEIANAKTGNRGIARLFNNPNESLKNADYLIFCVPSHIRKIAMQKLKGLVDPHTILGAFPGVSGFNEEIQEFFPNNNAYFSAQRVPFISRILEKGKQVDAEVKSKTYVAISDVRLKKNIRNNLKDLLNQEIDVLPSFELVNLTNSNPLLHTARLYEFLRRNENPYQINEHEMFYENWNDGASNILIEMDLEFQQIIRALNLETPTVLQHYGVKNTKELTNKLTSIDAFKGIKFPIKKKDSMHVVDFNSRYFIEDFDVGLRYTIRKGMSLGIDVKTMSRVLSFYDQNKVSGYKD